MYTKVIVAPMPLHRTLRIKKYENIARSRLLCRIALNGLFIDDAKELFKGSVSMQVEGFEGVILETCDLLLCFHVTSCLGLGPAFVFESPHTLSQPLLSALVIGNSFVSLTLLSILWSSLLL